MIMVALADIAAGKEVGVHSTTDCSGSVCWHGTELVVLLTHQRLWRLYGQSVLHEQPSGHHRCRCGNREGREPTLSDASSFNLS